MLQTQNFIFTATAAKVSTQNSNSNINSKETIRKTLPPEIPQFPF